jgi:hypothetical protein
MKLKSLTLILAVALGAQVAFAQQSKTDSSVEFRPHWYGQIQGGAAHTVGETVFKDLISPAGALSSVTSSILPSAFASVSVAGRGKVLS